MATIDEMSASAVAVSPPWLATVGGRWYRLARDLPVFPLAILIPFVLIAVFASLIAPYDPTEPIPGAKIFEPPVWMPGGSVHAALRKALDSGLMRANYMISLAYAGLAQWQCSGFVIRPEASARVRARIIRC